MTNNGLDEAACQLGNGPTGNQREWLTYHYALKYLPASYMKDLSLNSTVTKQPEKVKTLICVVCLKDKQYCKPCGGKG